MKAFIHASHISHDYPSGVQALADVSFRLPAGSFTTLIGPSGAGKSTLLRIVGGLIRPSRGQIRVGGREPGAGGPAIGIVFQKDNLMPWRTAYDNVRLPLELQGQTRAASHQRVQRLLDLVGLTGFEGSYPAELSGGMAQRVSLARALIHEPELLLLDEPFGALDALTRERMGQELLRVWQALPVTVFMVTHSIPEAVLLADEVLVLSPAPGTIVARVPVDLPRPRFQAMESRPAFQACTSAVRAVIESQG